jgi:hypothetical protein
VGCPIWAGKARGVLLLCCSFFSNIWNQELP